MLLAGAAGAATLYALQQLSRALRPKLGGSAFEAAESVGELDAAPPPFWGAPPHPAWRPPQPLPAPFAGIAMHTVDPARTPAGVMYPLVISAVVPRPIGFISTVSASGQGNLAPYSYFNVVAHSPFYVTLGFCRSGVRSHGRKDSLVNVLETGEFVINIISEWFVEAANHCCGNFEYGEDEMELSGLTPMPSVKVLAPRVKEAAVQLECKLRHAHELRDASGTVTTTVVLGEVVLAHIHEGVAGRSPSGKLVVDPEKLRPICRLGGNTYGRLARCFDLPRPDRGPGKERLAYTSSAT